MKKFYIACITALFFAGTCLADDVVTFEEIDVNADGYQNDFGEDGYFESGGFTFNCNYFPEWSTISPNGLIGRDLPCRTAPRPPSRH